MKKSTDMTGWIMKEHGFPESKLTVIEKELNYKKNNSVYWKCKCECGKELLVTTSNLKKQKSCGCLKNQNRCKHSDAKRNKKSRLYKIFHNMHSRCYNKNKPDYKWYGAIGIEICAEWYHNYINFKEWAMSHGYSDNLTIDRIDPSKNYCPENCRWITIQEQQNNRKNNHLLTYDNKTLTINQWAKEIGINREIIKDRLRLGWSIEDTLTKPVQNQRKGFEYNNEIHTLKEWSIITGISLNTLQHRIYDAKWNIEKALTTPARNYQKTTLK